MEILTRENAVTAISVAVALAAWYAIEEFSDLGTVVAIATLVLIGLVLPPIVLFLVSP